MAYNDAIMATKHIWASFITVLQTVLPYRETLYATTNIQVLVNLVPSYRKSVHATKNFVLGHLGPLPHTHYQDMTVKRKTSADMIKRESWAPWRKNESLKEKERNSKIYNKLVKERSTRGWNISGLGSAVYWCCGRTNLHDGVQPYFKDSTVISYCQTIII